MTKIQKIQFAIPFIGCDPFADSSVPNSLGGSIYAAVWQFFKMHHDGEPDSYPAELYVLEHKLGKLPITADMIADHDQWNVEPAQNFIKDYYIAFLAEHFDLKGMTLNSYDAKGDKLNVTMPLESLKAFGNNFLSYAYERKKKRVNFDNPCEHHADRVASHQLRIFTNGLPEKHSYSDLPDFMITDLIWLCMSIMLTHDGKKIDGSWGLHLGLESLCLGEVDSDFTEGLADAIGKVAESFIGKDWIKS